MFILGGFKFRDQQAILQFLAFAAANRFGEPVALPQLNVHASGVPYLDYLLREPISMAVPYEAGNGGSGTNGIAEAATASDLSIGRFPRGFVSLGVAQQ